MQSENNNMDVTVTTELEVSNTDNKFSVEFKNTELMNKYVNDFYEFMYDELMIYIDLVNSKNESVSKYNSFVEYWCYRLYGSYAVKRKIHKYGKQMTEEEYNSLTKEHKLWNKLLFGNTLNNNILLQFFYDKSIPSYDSSKSITRLCRHMVFDMKTLSIVSLGVVKSLKEDDFYNELDFTKDKDNHELYKVVVEEFLEGTMVVYNKSMSKFNYNILNDKLVDSEEVGEVESKVGEIESKVGEIESKVGEVEVMEDVKLENVNNKKNKNFVMATRRKIGTSFFNEPNKSFKDMFHENNSVCGVDLSLADDCLSDICLVFNVQHESNKIISSCKVNKNTLVASYLFKPTYLNNEILNKDIIPLLKLLNDKEEGKEEEGKEEGKEEDSMDNELLFTFDINDRLNVKNSFGKLSKDMVKELDVNLLSKSIKNLYNVEFKTVNLITTLNDTRENINKFVNDNLCKLSVDDLGYVIRDSDSFTRYKVRKNEYKELMELKGNLPISLDENNNENLFKCYWRLRHNGYKYINKFLKYFDNAKHEYKEKFNDYNKHIHELTHKLYMEYITVFVDKEKHAKDIEYLLAPLIGDLHKEYKLTKEPTTKNKVINYINNLPVYKVYWRIFNPENTNTRT
jgi:hypothetical protein